MLITFYLWDENKDTVGEGGYGVDFMIDLLDGFNKFLLISMKQFGHVYMLMVLVWCL